MPAPHWFVPVPGDTQVSTPFFTTVQPCAFSVCAARAGL
jgi:hypothetical protein